MSQQRPPRYVQIGTISASAPQSAQVKLWSVPVWRDMRDRNRANADKYFKRDVNKR